MDNTNSISKHYIAQFVSKKILYLVTKTNYLHWTKMICSLTKKFFSLTKKNVLTFQKFTLRKIPKTLKARLQTINVNISHFYKSITDQTLKVKYLCVVQN